GQNSIRLLLRRRGLEQFSGKGEPHKRWARFRQPCAHQVNEPTHLFPERPEGWQDTGCLIKLGKRLDQPFHPMKIRGQGKGHSLITAPLLTGILFSRRDKIVWLHRCQVLPPMLFQEKRRLSREGNEADELKFPSRNLWHGIRAEFLTGHLLPPCRERIL